MPLASSRGRSSSASTSGERRVLVVLGAFFALQVIDSLLTGYSLSVGLPVWEGSPVMAWLQARLGMAGALGLKLAVMLIVCAKLWAARSAPGARLVAHVGLGLQVAVVGVSAGSVLWASLTLVEGY